MMPKNESNDDRVTEGNVAEVRDETGVNKMPGHTSTVATWEASEAGQHFINEIAPEREKEIADEAKAIEEDRKKSEKDADANKKAAEAVAKTAEADAKAAAKEADKNDGQNDRS